MIYNKSLDDALQVVGYFLKVKWKKNFEKLNLNHYSIKGYNGFT